MKLKVKNNKLDHLGALTCSRSVIKFRLKRNNLSLSHAFNYIDKTEN